MKHKISKLKVTAGQDANSMLLKKLVRNFVAHGYLTTTATKAFYLKQTIEKLTGTALSYDEAAKNTLLPYFGDVESVLHFVEIAKEQAKDKVASGVVKVIKYGPRVGDAAPKVKLVWKHEIVSSKETKAKKTPAKG